MFVLQFQTQTYNTGRRSSFCKSPWKVKTSKTLEIKKPDVSHLSCTIPAGNLWPSNPTLSPIDLTTCSKVHYLVYLPTAVNGTIIMIITIACIAYLSKSVLVWWMTIKKAPKTNFFARVCTSAETHRFVCRAEIYPKMRLKW